MKIRILMDGKYADMEVDDEMLQALEPCGIDAVASYLAEATRPYFEAMLQLDDDDE